MICYYCAEEITEDHCYRVPRITASEEAIVDSLHDECFTRMLVGGVNHLRNLCTCCGGTQEPDPLHLTKRQAAIAAWAYYHGARGL